MIFETAFNIGDRGWVYYGTRSNYVQQATIGKITVEHTETTLYEDDETGYGEPVLEHKEKYMCKETGVGSGTVFTYGETIFKTKQECEAAFAGRIAAQAEEKIAAELRSNERKLAEESGLRARLAEIERIKLEAGV